jgi:hypothetical protein
MSVRRTAALVATAAVLASGCTSSGATKAQSSVSAAAGASATVQPAGASATVQPAAASTAGPAWDSVLSQISADGSVSTATALEAFSLVFGPLPGVTLPAGDAGILPDGTGPMRWLIGHWHDLTAAQQAAALPLLPQPVTSAAPTSHALGEGRSLTIATVANKPIQTYPPHRPDSYYTDAANQAEADIAAKVGRPLGVPITARDTGKSLNEYADTVVLTSSGGYVGAPAKCQIDLTEQGDALDDVDLQRVLHHEVWHCYEGVILGLARFYNASTPEWIIEGEAEWVGTTSAPTAPLDSDFWDGYLNLPARPLFSRSYDAEGFYNQLQQTGTDIWSRLIPILQAGSNTAAFDVAGGNGEPLLDAWAAGYFRDPSRGSAWDIVGPGIPADKPGQTRLSAPVDATVTAAAAPYSNTVYSVIPGDADLEQFTFSGHARVSDASGHDYTVDKGGLLACVNPKGCTCPDNETSPASQPLSGYPIDLAVTGDPSGDTGTVHGESLKEACSCGSDGTAVPPGTYKGTIHAVLNVKLHVSGQLTADGSGTSTGDGTVTVVSDGKTVSGSMSVKATGTSKLSFDPIGIGDDSYFGGLSGTISGPAGAPIVTGTLASTDAVAGPQSSPLKAGLHLTQVTCGSISGDLVAMFVEITKPVSQYVTVTGSGKWTAPRTH